MATYTFETLTQDDASNFEAGDTLIFSTLSIDPSDVTVTNSANGFNGTTLTVGSKSLQFPGAELASGTIRFFGQEAAGNDATLYVGSHLVDGAVNVSADDDGSVAYTFGGADTITVSGDGIALVYAGEGNDVITVTSPSGQNVFGEGGDDSITGGAEGDHLYGYGLTGTPADDGNDTINGAAGNDYIQGNAGEDSLLGGDGRDRINGGADNDFINGGNGNDTVNGNKGEDEIVGGSGNDSLRGGADNDIIDGGADNDFLQGDLGDDTLVGGDGFDLLTGGAGNDVFFFNDGDASFDVDEDGNVSVDYVTDFTIGQDILNIGDGFAGDDDNIKIPTGVIFTDVAAAFEFATETASITAGQVLALQVGTDTYLFYDASGGTAIDSAVGLLGVTAANLSEDDIAFVTV